MVLSFKPWGGKGSFGDNEDDFDTCLVFNDTLRVEGKQIEIGGHNKEDELLLTSSPFVGTEKKLTFALSPLQ